MSSEQDSSASSEKATVQPAAPWPKFNPDRALSELQVLELLTRGVPENRIARMTKLSTREIRRLAKIAAEEAQEPRAPRIVGRSERPVRPIRPRFTGARTVPRQKPGEPAPRHAIIQPARPRAARTEPAEEPVQMAFPLD
ncbi:hypothetical protein [Streptomyces sp. NBC_01304]|uniref:hypothetical protein n=1 Tax=Streptomyces sp. NBC_01304 TaxID=2903818 RepID=UPI002E14A31A|nr:hypothetical protein OG430_48060 [Streptomyces sp. NBC_01304]